ncbi:MAG: GldG family protein [Rhizobiaceae bacterium]|nr:GldG family protein [Rhizobiaceae bacterium]
MIKLTGYGDRISVSPNETIRFHVNCEYESFRADLIRIICGDTSPEGPGVKIEEIESSFGGEYKGRAQKIHAGSFAVVEKMPALASLESFTVQAVIQPTTPTKGRQAIAACYDEAGKAGFGLIIDEKGCAALDVRDGKGGSTVVSSGAPLRRLGWYVVAASFDASTGTASVYQRPFKSYTASSEAAFAEAPASFAPAAAPLFFAGEIAGRSSRRLLAKNFYNGKLEAPRLSSVALGASEIEQLRTTPFPSSLSLNLLGAWDFSKDISGTKISDISANGADGHIVNLPARGVVGHLHTLDSHDWKMAPEQWGAIHFHDDDIYDAEWDVDFELTVPSGLRSGIYAVRLRAGEEAYYISFVVRAAPAKRKKVLFLFSLATYIAYANEHFGTNSAMVELHLNRVTVLHPHQVFLNEHREYGHSLYDVHSDGSGVYYSSRLRPIMNMQPFVEANHGAGPAHLWLFNADTHITDWMEAHDVDYDVATDEDLHVEGISLFEGYDVVITSTHPEYYSLRMLDALQRYIDRGGRLMYLGGNGFYWRIAYHKELPGVIEVRRAEGGNRAWEPPTGEYYHSFTGEYGGMWRRQGGRAPNAICGVAYVAQGFDESTFYTRNPDSFDTRAAFIFAGVGADEKIGDFGLIGNGAAGMEVDAINYDLGTPPHTLVLASSHNHTPAHLLALDEMLFNIMDSGGDVCEQVKADMVFFETQGGGAVFSVGSIAYAGSLSHNKYENNVSRITGNVLKRFLKPEPFVVPAK